jgi:uncharacterized protein (UPF0333 family)
MGVVHFMRRIGNSAAELSVYIKQNPQGELPKPIKIFIEEDCEARQLWM